MTDWKALSDERGVMLREMSRRIEALEEGAHRLNRKIEWWEDKYRQQACRAEALEAALRDIAATKSANPWTAIEAMQTVARAALVLEPKHWPQDAIDQEMIERTDDGWSQKKAGE